MGEILTRSGAGTPGPVTDAAEEFECALQEIVTGCKIRREKREAPEPPRERGAQPGNQNARKHGFTATTFRLAEGEDPQEYERARADALAHYMPEDQQELALVMKIVNESWLLQRLACVASDLMLCNLEQGEELHHAFTFRGGEGKFLSLSRYQSFLERSVDRTRKRLKEIRSERREGFWQPEEANDETNRQTDESNPEAQVTKRIEETELPELPPMEEIILEKEEKKQPFSTSDLIRQGYRFKDPTWKAYESPYDTDLRQETKR